MGGLFCQLLTALYNLWTFITFYIRDMQVILHTNSGVVAS